MHFECADEYIYQIGDRCMVCDSKLQLHSLQRQPRVTSEERQLMRRQREVAHRRSLNASSLTRSWRFTVWPIMRVMYSDRVGVRTALNRIVREDRMSFRQRWFDGGGNTEPDVILKEIQWIEGKYDLLSRHTQRRLQRDWKHAEPLDDLTWNQDITQ